MPAAVLVKTTLIQGDPTKKATITTHH